MVTSLSKHFFVINNIDKSSGLINLSYSGDPEKYVDCGQMSSYVKNARGERTYVFPGARQHEVYEVMNNGNLVFLDRKLALEGRANLIVEELPNGQTMITATIKYILQKDVRLTDPVGHQGNVNETVSFNTGDSAEFSNGGFHATCRATGELESELLSMVS